MIAHRGASAELPENTLPAFERAIELGADFVELDVHLDTSGHLVVTHDRPVEGRQYPQFEEVVEVCRGRIAMMVELKQPSSCPGVVPRTLDLLGEEDMVLSFERPALVEARALRPALRTIQHVGVGVSLDGAAGAWGVGFSNARVTSRELDEARSRGLATTVYTVNDETRALELAELGVTGIFTDDPARMLSVPGLR